MYGKLNVYSICFPLVCSRIKNYENRNDPSKPTGLSGMSPYLHYGHISAQRCALEARKFRKAHPKVSEVIAERDNCCNYLFIMQ